MATGEWSRAEALRDAVEQVLGEEAIRYTRAL
jgi:hypothetical protein